MGYQQEALTSSSPSKINPKYLIIQTYFYRQLIFSQHIKMLKSLDFYFLNRQQFHLLLNSDLFIYLHDLMKKDMQIFIHQISKNAENIQPLFILLMEQLILIVIMVMEDLNLEQFSMDLDFLHL